jgi:hypothetical protein
MNSHIITAGVELKAGFIDPRHSSYLREWRENAIQSADEGDVSASTCLQAVMIECVLYGSPTHDWIGIMDEFLLNEGFPIAYSKAFGSKLYNFENQFLQSSIHAIHTRWWIEALYNTNIDHERYARLVLSKKQTDGLFYDKDISETVLRHRMKSELTLSMAMAIEILEASQLITRQLAIELATDLCCPLKCPPLGYMSMEYFRIRALEMLGYPAMFPAGIAEHITACSEDLNYGWCDFSMASKVDAYMGTKKRTQRDRPIHSPLICCCVRKLIQLVTDNAKRTSLIKRLDDYKIRLRNNPFDIPAFQMRDIPIAFGLDYTPIEIICASELISQCPIK